MQAWRTIDLHGTAKYSEESFTKLLETKARLAESARDSVCGHFQWIFNSHDNPGRVQPDGALRRIDKIGPINYKGLVTAWEEPTPAYYMYRQRYVPVGRHSMATNKTAADRNRDLVKASRAITTSIASIVAAMPSQTSSDSNGWPMTPCIATRGDRISKVSMPCRPASAISRQTSEAPRATSCSNISVSDATACGTTCPCSQPCRSKPTPPPIA